MLLAGVDIGNSTTEIAVARVEPGRPPEWLSVLRRPTTGPKGSPACAAGVAELVERAERRVGERPRRLLVAELHPVETGLLELSHTHELDLARTAIARPASATPSGRGVACGRLTGLGRLAGPPQGDAIAIVAGEDFEDAAAALREARARGWRITGAIVRDDDGVLIGNRFDRSLPIVDEVADAASLPEGAAAAIEVAAPGEAVESLADPLRLARLLDLSPAQARLARHAARALAGHRAAVAVRAAADPVPAADGASEPLATLRDGSTLRISRATRSPAIGEVARAPGVTGEVLDAFWCGLPAPREDPRLARRLLERDAVALAVLQRGSPGDLLAELSALCDAGVEVVGRESAAAVLGAGTTPRAGRTPFVIDLGGGTVDLHRTLGEGEQAVVAAGGGELVTSICAALLGSARAVAERAKRRRSVRVETPFVVHHEDGSRSFRGEPAAAEALARLCVLDGGALEPLPARLAPEVWASLRRAAKRDVLAANALRALDAAGGAPRGELVTLVGGCAADAEAVDEIGAALAPLELAVARGDVLGRFGPRAAVAVGLVLANAGRRP